MMAFCTGGVAHKGSPCFLLKHTRKLCNKNEMQHGIKIISKGAPAGIVSSGCGAQRPCGEEMDDFYRRFQK